MSSWFKRPVNIAVTIGAAILMVVVIASLIWGIMHHKEGEILKVCWIQGKAFYSESAYAKAEKVYDESCEGFEKLTWPAEQIPITLTPISADGIEMVENESEVRVLKQAVGDLNRQLGFQMFRVVVGLQPADAEIHFGGAFERGDGATPPAGHVTHYRLGMSEQLWGLVAIRSDISAIDRSLFHVLEHELLHLAGLAHDEHRSSIMYPYTEDDWMLDKIPIVFITDRDKSLLRDLYYMQ